MTSVRRSDFDVTNSVQVSSPRAVLRAVVGLITGLFHDVGYLRRTDERDSRNGAEFTRTHVSRGARFLEEYLPVLGFGSWVPVATEIIHFTGYEQPFARIEERVSDPRD